MDNFFKTSVIDEAAYLLTKGVKFMGVSMNGRRATFLFENREDCEMHQSDFINNAEVSARELLIRKKEIVDLVSKKIDEVKGAQY